MIDPLDWHCLKKLPFDIMKLEKNVFTFLFTIDVKKREKNPVSEGIPIKRFEGQ